MFVLSFSTTQQISSARNLESAKLEVTTSLFFLLGRDLLEFDVWDSPELTFTQILEICSSSFRFSRVASENPSSLRKLAFM